MPSTFNSQSYVKYALSFEPDRFTTEIQLRFRTREEQGELFRVSDQHNREYGILEIQQSKMRFRYNLNSLRTEEKEIWLSSVFVDDGQWHVEGGASGKDLVRNILTDETELLLVHSIQELFISPSKEWRH